MGTECWAPEVLPHHLQEVCEMKSHSPEFDERALHHLAQESVPSCSGTHRCVTSNKSLTLSGPPAGRFLRPHLSQNLPNSLTTRSELPCSTTACKTLRPEHSCKEAPTFTLLPLPNPPPDSTRPVLPPECQAVHALGWPPGWALRPPVPGTRLPAILGGCISTDEVLSLNQGL